MLCHYPVVRPMRGIKSVFDLIHLYVLSINDTQTLYPHIQFILWFDYIHFPWSYTIVTCNVIEGSVQMRSGNFHQLWPGLEICTSETQYAKGQQQTPGPHRQKSWLLRIQCKNVWHGKILEKWNTAKSCHCKSVATFMEISLLGHVKFSGDISNINTCFTNGSCVLNLFLVQFVQYFYTCTKLNASFLCSM